LDLNLYNTHLCAAGAFLMYATYVWIFLNASNTIYACVFANAR